MKFKSTAMYHIKTGSVIHSQDDTKMTKTFSCPELESKKKGHYVVKDLVIFPFAWLSTPNPHCGRSVSHSALTSEASLVQRTHAPSSNALRW